MNAKKYAAYRAARQKYAAYRAARQKLIDSLLLKVDEADWHGVSDAANDLRVMEARHDVNQFVLELR